MVAPVGTVAVISEAETTVNVAGTPLNDTPVEPVRSDPRTLIVAPILPEFGSIVTNGSKPTESLNTVPASLLAGPPYWVVP